MDLLAYLLGGGCILLGAGIGAWFRFGPGARVGAVADAILGSPEVKDRRGGTLDPGNPGLVHRVAQVEEAVVEFRHMTGLLTEVLKRTDVLEHKVNLLELAATERVASHLENAKLFDMVAKRDSSVIDGEAD